MTAPPPVAPAGPATGPYPTANPGTGPYPTANPGTGPQPTGYPSNGTGPYRTPTPPARPAPQSATPAPATAAATAAGGAFLAQVPYLIVLACTVGGVIWAWRGAHAVSNGAGVVGGAFLAAALARLLLPQSAVGLLANRRRIFDVLAFAILGGGLLILALVLPPT